MLAARAAVAGAEAWDAEPWRNPGVRRRPATRPASGVARLAMVFGALAGLLLLYVGEQAYVISLTYRLTDVKASLHSATVETDRLQLRMSELSSPQRIEQVAREDLHLVPGGQPQYVTEAAAVAMVPPDRRDGRGPTLMARLGSWLRGSSAEAHAAQ